jgi:hypothetical protein
MVGEWARGCYGPIWGVGQGGDGSGEQLAGGQGGAAATESVPARLRPGQGKGRLGKLLQLQGKVEARLVSGCSRPGAELAAAASDGAGGGSGRGRRARRRAGRHVGGQAL